MSEEQPLRTENPFEQQIERALLRAGEPFTSDHDGTNASRLDFCLINRDIHIEVKTMHSERIAEQMSRVSNAIVAQGVNAIAYLAELINRSDLTPVVQPPAANVLQSARDIINASTCSPMYGYEDLAQRIASAITAAVDRQRQFDAKLAEMFAAGEDVTTGRLKAVNVAAAIRNAK